MDEENTQPEETVSDSEEVVTNVEPEVEEDEGMAFPNARIVRIIREEVKSGKQIRGEVKTAINDWLGGVLRNVAKDMDKTQYGSIGLADFKRATMPFDMIKHIVADRDRLLLAIDKLKADADQIKRDMLRFYTTLTGEEEKEQQQ